MALAGRDGDPAVTVAAGLLEALGASVDAATPEAARIVPAGVPIPQGGLPEGTFVYACGLAIAAAALAGVRSGTRFEVFELGVAVQLWLPEVMAASYRSPTALRPKPPRAAPGGGWYHADLGSPGAGEDFERMLAILPADVDAPALAEAAQLWRLPVCDYRPFRSEPARLPLSWTTNRETEPRRPRTDTAAPGAGGRPLRVCDLTGMWAGPLATWLLEQLGAEVEKVEPSFRPDGSRAVNGGGIYPDGVGVDPGNDSAMWNALNRHKRRADLDLRHPDQLERFVSLAAAADVVIDSFSPRVMPNFGVVDRLLDAPAPPLLASMPAFPAGPHRDWVAFGNGVHALSGLGDAGGGRFRQPPVSYPDPVAGFAGALAVLAGVVGREHGNPVRSVEVSLAGASQPLLSGSPAEGEAHPAVGEILLEAAAGAGLMEAVRVAGHDLLHPASPIAAGCEPAGRVGGRPDTSW